MTLKTAEIISGREISKKLKEEMKVELIEFKKKYDVTPHLVVILVGEDPASKSYVTAKHKACEFVGIKSTIITKPETISEVDLLREIDKLNNDKDVHGILVQLPLPRHIDEKNVINKISLLKDVDGFHPLNIGNMHLKNHAVFPCTPKGVITMLKEKNIEIKGKHAVVIGRSNIVGKPMAQLLLNENATVTICHRYTEDLSVFTKQADILVVAVGKPNLVTADMVKDDVVVIDVGVNRIESGKLVGDVDFESVKEKASYITPVPGGVGPMTITTLLQNTIECAEYIINNK